MSYIDGYVILVPAGKKEAYRAMAIKMAAILKECGATRTVECWGDDLPEAKLTGFKLAVKAESDEVVVFSWVEWPSKAARDEGKTKFMNDPRMKEFSDMPFNGKRMLKVSEQGRNRGGFKHIDIQNEQYFVQRMLQIQLPATSAVAPSSRPPSPFGPFAAMECALAHIQTQKT